MYMYVFGYGSLMWKQGFEFEDKHYGYIKGFIRRFWQGTEDHRGVPGAPGRVVSILPSKNSEEKIWGVTFQIHPDKSNAVRDNLKVREKGYEIKRTTFYPVDSNKQPFEVDLFIANMNASTYLGPAPVPEIAEQIYHSRGRCGPNVEYLMKLIWFSRHLFPHVEDEHLDELEMEIHAIAKRKGDTIETYSLHEF